MGYPQFVYRGYNFVVLDPWPEFWPDDWYRTDEVAVDYDDGYDLFSRRDPQVRLAIMLVR
jgi:hypothetical protein